MSEEIRHECGIALLRLRKPLEYYFSQYGTWMYGINKIYLLMEKQHNRGQDGAGLAVVKIDPQPGSQYIDRIRSVNSQSLLDIFEQLFSTLETIKNKNPERFLDPTWAKMNVPFAGEVFLGHLRYGTFGNNDINYVHPLVRENNWKTRNLIIAGNFNLTNTSELFEHLIELGQHPKAYSDTVTILEKIAHFLDDEVERIFNKYKRQGFDNKTITDYISKEIDIVRILNNSAWRWDGGFVIGGIIGNGDSFIFRDPWGIRPAYYYCNEEIVAAASERPAIQTTFNVKFDDVEELPPGHALIIKYDGEHKLEKIIEPYKKKSCSFERIYFSRGTDKEIYNERKMLGKLIAPKVLHEINYDLENTIFTYIPNTAIDAFLGLIEAIREYCDQIKKEKLLNRNLTEQEIDKILKIHPRIEKLAVKDLKLRTFITADDNRKDLVAHIYDVTYGVVNPSDTVVIVDDSIVRGTTLKESILTMFDRLNPKRIVIVSSAPQIRFPDCYGIDIAKLQDFIAFEAAIALLKEKKMENLLNYIYKKCKEQENWPKEEIVNYVKLIYDQFTDDEISKKIAEMLHDNKIKAELKIIYNTVENLHKACPNHTGDWYFTGDYPTPGGNKIVNTAFINYIEGKNIRAYS
ncbi:MAG: amidophosphoribosyltransferase [Bacteroidales bacterium]|nr:amidophosphoribosyltransferase [Bacteroidales bacterium]